MNTLSIGNKINLNQNHLSINIKTYANFIVDGILFPIDKQTQTMSKQFDYAVLFSNPSSPDGKIKLTKNNQNSNLNELEYELNVENPNFSKYVIALSIDGQNTFNQCEKLEMTINADENYQFILNKDDIQDLFKSGLQSLILLEIYQHNGSWRFATVSQGFNGGLSDLIKYYGGEVKTHDDETPKTPTQNQAPTKIDLSKKAESLGACSRVIELSKKAQISLEKKNLDNVKAEVVLVLDNSGSMNWQYENGTVKEIVNRLIPLAINFDDNQSIDFWAFASKPAHLDNINMKNYRDVIYDKNEEVTSMKDKLFSNKQPKKWKTWNTGMPANNETSVIKEINKMVTSRKNNLPIYVLFISDGGVHDNEGIERAIKEAASLPIFWQFVGVGGSNYGILERLDDMKGRVVDNANFFSIHKLSDLSEEELYDKMLEEFPNWLKEIKKLNILSS